MWEYRLAHCSRCIQYRSRNARLLSIWKPLKTMFLEVGVWGEAPHIALLLFVEKQKGRFLEVPICHEYSIESGKSQDGIRKSACFDTGAPIFECFTPNAKYPHHARARPNKDAHSSVRSVNCSAVTYISISSSLESSYCSYLMPCASSVLTVSSIRA